MTVGRPSKYNSKLCNTVLHLMKEGYSKTSVAADLGINRDTLYQWCKDYPEFSDTIKKGEIMTEAYWENILRESAIGKRPNANPTLLIFIMKSRFRWRDKSPYEESFLDKLDKESEEEDRESSVCNYERISEIVKRYAPVMLIDAKQKERSNLA